MKRGFTLIEILVVIALIGVLSGLLIVSFQGVRKSARDGKRKADIEQIRAGLEMCRQQSATKSYPVGTDYQSGCTTYIPQLYSDPLAIYRYAYVGTANNYALCAYLEGGTATTCPSISTCGTTNCGIGGTAPTCNYTTCNP